MNLATESFAVMTTDFAMYGKASFSTECLNLVARALYVQVSICTVHRH
jgi:hypothetical protein